MEDEVSSDEVRKVLMACLSIILVKEVTLLLASQLAVQVSSFVSNAIFLRFENLKKINFSL